MGNEAQSEYWNGDAGQNWVRNADKLDLLLQPFIEELLKRVHLNQSEHVLDIGCGAGALTLSAAAIVGPERGAVGVDVSAPLVNLARSRAAVSGQPATFVVDDASAFRAEKPLDAAISRFGVMFFDDPAEAFTSIRRNLRPEGRLAFVCWAPLRENPWATIALDAVSTMLTDPLPSPAPGTPGPFSMADADDIRAVLHGAGWRGVQVEAFRPELVLPGETVPEIAEFLMQMGPAARVLQAQMLDHNNVKAALCERLSQLASTGTQIKLPSSTWIVSATAS